MANQQYTELKLTETRAQGARQTPSSHLRHREEPRELSRTGVPAVTSKPNDHHARAAGRRRVARQVRKRFPKSARNIAVAVLEGVVVIVDTSPIRREVSGTVGVVVVVEGQAAPGVRRHGDLLKPCEEYFVGFDHDARETAFKHLFLHDHDDDHLEAFSLADGQR